MHNLNSKGWNSQAHKGSPGKSESSNLSRDNVGREIGRTPGGDLDDALRSGGSRAVREHISATLAAKYNTTYFCIVVLFMFVCFSKFRFL